MAESKVLTVALNPYRGAFVCISSAYDLHVPALDPYSMVSGLRTGAVGITFVLKADFEMRASLFAILGAPAPPRLAIFRPGLLRTLRARPSGFCVRVTLTSADVLIRFMSVSASSVDKTYEGCS
jgi:hypothetical protein